MDPLLKLASMDPFAIAVLQNKDGMTAEAFLTFCTANNLRVFRNTTDKKRGRFVEFYQSYRNMSRDVILPYITATDGELQRDTVITLDRVAIKGWFARTTSDVAPVIDALTDAFIASFQSPIRLEDFATECISISNKANERFTHNYHMRSTYTEEVDDALDVLLGHMNL